MTDEQIKRMAERFLQWKLPADFSPDAGISFKPAFNEHTPHPMRHEPTGTNLLTLAQAVEMARYMVAAMVAPPAQGLVDSRPKNCRFRLRDEGKPYPRSSCQACGKGVLTGFGNSCSRAAPQPDETAALRAKLAEMTRKANGLLLQKIEAEADRDEERKLADDLAGRLRYSDDFIKQELGGLRNPARTEILARHAARRKEQQG